MLPRTACFSCLCGYEKFFAKFFRIVLQALISALSSCYNNKLFYHYVMVYTLHILGAAKGSFINKNRTLKGEFMHTAELGHAAHDEQCEDAIRKSILIVDDEEDLTWSISKTLARHDKDFTVTCAHNGDEAMAVLARQPFDVVVSDIRMPGRDGLQLLHEINARYPRTKVIIMTAYGSHDTRAQIAAKGAAFYLEKPFEIRSLRKLIYEALNLNPPSRGNVSEFDRPNAYASERFDEGFFLKEKLEAYCGNLNAVMLVA